MKPRAIIGLVIVAACGLGAWYVYSQTKSDPGFAIGLAMGNPESGDIELHVVVAMAMTMQDKLTSVTLADGTVSRQTWPEWIAEHFVLRDDSGQKIELRKEGWSNLIKERQALNPEFYLVGKLKSDVRYTFDYIPSRDSSVRHRYAFVAPAEAQPFERVYFETIKGDVP
ncbi:MAG: hypothetical protein PVJ57_01835 [Phycisphaerae bacterium]|jgi:hypothetical protein